MTTYRVTTRYGDEVTVYTGVSAMWQYIRTNGNGQHLYDVEVNEDDCVAFERALDRASDEVIDYRVL